jgi:hypothetical protein
VRPKNASSKSLFSVFFANIVLSGRKSQNHSAQILSALRMPRRARGTREVPVQRAIRLLRQGKPPKFVCGSFLCWQKIQRTDMLSVFLV